MSHSHREKQCKKIKQMHMGLRIKPLHLVAADGVALFKADNMRRMVQDTGSNNLLMKYRQ